MKEILTEWRKFLNERDPVNEAPAVISKISPAGQRAASGQGRLGDMTIEELGEKIVQARQDADRQDAGEGDAQFAAKVLGKFAMLIDPTGVSAAIGAAEIVKDIMNRANREMDSNPETAQEAKNYPLLDLLDVDPYLVSKIDKGVLEDLDKRYEAYIKELPDETLVSDIVDVNVFIRDEIEKDTNRNVVIRDENPED
jgi:hypothetical protein